MTRTPNHVAQIQLFLRRRRSTDVDSVVSSIMRWSPYTNKTELLKAAAQVKAHMASADSSPAASSQTFEKEEAKETEYNAFKKNVTNNNRKSSLLAAATAVAATAAASADFESKHPRNKDGEFTDKGDGDNKKNDSDNGDDKGYSKINTQINHISLDNPQTSKTLETIQDELTTIGNRITEDVSTEQINRIGHELEDVINFGTWNYSALLHPIGELQGKLYFPKGNYTTEEAVDLLKKASIKEIPEMEKMWDTLDNLEMAVNEKVKHDFQTKKSFWRNISPAELNAYTHYQEITKEPAPFDPDTDDSEFDPVGDGHGGAYTGFVAMSTEPDIMTGDTSIQIEFDAEKMRPISEPLEYSYSEGWADQGEERVNQKYPLGYAYQLEVRARPGFALDHIKSIRVHTTKKNYLKYKERFGHIAPMTLEERQPSSY